jgi:hypothetical protein
MDIDRLGKEYAKEKSTRRTQEEKETSRKLILQSEVLNGKSFSSLSFFAIFTSHITRKAVVGIWWI